MNLGRLLRVGLGCWLLGWAAAYALAQKSETDWYDEGVGLMGQHKLVEAEAAFRESVKADPRYKEAWVALAQVLQAEGKADQAALAKKMAEEAPAARAGAPPPLTEEQKQALGEAPAAPPAAPPAEAPAPAGPPAPPAAVPPPAPGQPLPPLTARDAAGKPKRMLKLSQYDKSAYCDLAVGAGGVLHAVFTDQPNAMKPAYLYYRSSTDGGATWSEPKNLSDDESGLSASWARVIIDGQGRVYAIWKYVGRNELLDGPGGHGAGVIAYRCLQGGAWSRTVRLNSPKLAAYSWFAALGPGGAVHLVWSQMSADAMRIQGWGAAQYANLVQQAVLDGAAPGAPKALISTSLPTKARLDAAHAAGHDIPYDQQRPKKDGLHNLRGYIDAAGAAHFVAEDPGISEGPSSEQTGARIVLWDGAKLRPLYAYERLQTYNNFNNPPTLLFDAQGREHLIRAPEKAEKASVRDYPLEGGEMGDPVEAIAARDGKGIITAWQAMQLPGGRMVVTAALSPKGGAHPDDLELYITFSDGGGKWSEPLSVTDNQARHDFFHKETGGGAAVAASTTYSPRYASVVIAPDGHPCVLMVDSEDTIVGLTSVQPGAAAEGRTTTGGLRVDAPMVFFLKL